MTDPRVEAQTVDIYDGDRLLGSTPIEDGHWTFEASGLSAGPHQFMAAKDGVQSNVWEIAVEPFAVDQSPMVLDGVSVLVAWPLTGADAPKNTDIRLPTGGKPPYSYTSDQPEIATVTSAGKVKGVSNGKTTITVRDAGTGRVSYGVEVRNVWRLAMSLGPFNALEAMSWIENNDGVPSIMIGAVVSMSVTYVKPFPIGHSHYWLCPDSSTPNYWFYNSGSADIRLSPGVNANITGAWCFTPT